MRIPFCAFIVSFLVAVPGVAAKNENPPPTAREDFFIVSSVDVVKKELLLKAPTEVTQLLRVTEKTVFLDEQGKALVFKNLRAGDTVYVSFRVEPDGRRVALRVRKGPMTLEELRRRFLDFQ